MASKSRRLAFYFWEFTKVNDRKSKADQQRG